MKRKEVLESAIQTVCADRQDMALLKIARIKVGEFKADNYVDLCGYGALAYEVSNKGEEGC